MAKNPAHFPREYVSRKTQGNGGPALGGGLSCVGETFVARKLVYGLLKSKDGSPPNANSALEKPGPAGGRVEK
jgi:hypothetical protein